MPLKRLLSRRLRRVVVVVAAAGDAVGVAVAVAPRPAPRATIEDGAGATPDELEADLPDFEDEVLPLPQHSGFGSVWDSQIGVAPERRPAAPASPRGEDAIDDLDVEGEPEVPEYLLAEKRQQDRRRGGHGGRGGGYRSAIDRERYGSGPRPAFQRGPVRPGRSPGRPVSGGRASAQAMEPIEQTPGGDPWSEVPPDVQEMLRAELARRQAASGQPSGRQPATGRRTTDARRGQRCVRGRRPG